jgi:hypothetical protein
MGLGAGTVAFITEQRAVLINLSFYRGLLVDTMLPVLHGPISRGMDILYYTTLGFSSLTANIWKLKGGLTKFRNQEFNKDEAGCLLGFSVM